MANWTRRQLTKTALAFVSNSLLLLSLKSGRVNAQSCGSYNYYDPYDGGGGDGGGGGVCGAGYQTLTGNCF
jgi:hypothetical protein